MTRAYKIFGYLQLLFCLLNSKSSNVLGGVTQLAHKTQTPTTTTTEGTASTLFTITDDARLQLETKARAETEALLNSLFRAQIAYFSKVKESLAPQTQRARDIDAYNARINEAIALKDIEAKDQKWKEIFKEFSKSPLLLNRQSETGLTNEQYEEILADGGIQEITKNFLADVSTYFWNMAKHSGKAIETVFEDYARSKRAGLYALFQSNNNKH